MHKIALVAVICAIIAAPVGFAAGVYSGNMLTGYDGINLANNVDLIGQNEGVVTVRAVQENHQSVIRVMPNGNVSGNVDISGIEVYCNDFQDTSVPMCRSTWRIVEENGAPTQIEFEEMFRDREPIPIVFSMIDAGSANQANRTIFMSMHWDESGRYIDFHGTELRNLNIRNATITN